LTPNYEKIGLFHPRRVPA